MNSVNNAEKWEYLRHLKAEKYSKEKKNAKQKVNKFKKKRNAAEKYKKFGRKLFAGVSKGLQCIFERSCVCLWVCQIRCEEWKKAKRH